MDKVLFYVKSFDEAKKVFEHVTKLYSMGWEVGFDTPFPSVAELLCYCKVLVTKAEAFDYDYYVYFGSNPKMDGYGLSFDELEELL